MARISKFAQYKPAVDRLFQSGKIPSDVYGLFPDIAGSTIRDWFDKGIEQGLWVQPQPIPSTITLNPSTLIINPQCDDDGMSDYEWAYVQCRKLVNEACSDGLKIQALNTFVKLLQLKATIHVETTVKTSDVTDYKNMSTEDLSRLYREKLENNFN